MVKRKFRNVDERIIAAFTSDEIRSGTGTEVYYGIRLETSGSVTYGLIETAVSSAGSTDTEKVLNTNATFNFDLAPFNLPTTVKGTAYFSGTGRSTTASAGPTLAVTIQKVSGSTTDITSTITSTTVGDNTIEEFLLPMPLTQTHFKKGDILRVKIVTTNASASKFFFINPLTSTGEPMRVFVPHDIDR